MRPERFVTRKVVAAACRIAAGSGETLHLGNVEVARDWGWAPEYVEAMWMMLQLEAPEDFVIATGEVNSLGSFVETAFHEVGLDWKQHVKLDPAFLRPTDLAGGLGDPSLAAKKLGWKARYHMREVVQMMVEGEKASL